MPAPAGFEEGEAVLKSLKVKNFTAFPAARLDFAKGLNVIVGENGTGKTHLLKLPYAVMAVSAAEGRKRNGRQPTKAFLQTRLAEKLVNVFRPEMRLGRLAHRHKGRSGGEFGEKGGVERCSWAKPGPPLSSTWFGAEQVRGRRGARRLSVWAGGARCRTAIVGPSRVVPMGLGEIIEASLEVRTMEIRQIGQARGGCAGGVRSDTRHRSSS